MGKTVADYISTWLLVGRDRRHAVEQDRQAGRQTDRDMETRWIRLGGDGTTMDPLSPLDIVLTILEPRKAETWLSYPRYRSIIATWPRIVRRPSPRTNQPGRRQIARASRGSDVASSWVLLVPAVDSAFCFSNLVQSSMHQHERTRRGGTTHKVFPTE